MNPVELQAAERTGPENAWLADRFGTQTLFDRTGMPLPTINALPKMVRLKANEPKVWNAAHQFLLYEDFFLRRLSGKARISGCVASQTQMYDLAAGDWAEDTLSDCGIDSRRLARVAWEVPNLASLDPCCPRCLVPGLRWMGPLYLEIPCRDRFAGKH